MAEEIERLKIKASFSAITGADNFKRNGSRLSSPVEHLQFMALSALRTSATVKGNKENWAVESRESILRERASS